MILALLAADQILRKDPARVKKVTVLTPLESVKKIFRSSCQRKAPRKRPSRKARLKNRRQSIQRNIQPLIRQCPPVILIHQRNLSMIL